MHGDVDDPCEGRRSKSRDLSMHFKLSRAVKNAFRTSRRDGKISQKFSRSQYKQQWNSISRSEEAAKLAVSLRDEGQRSPWAPLLRWRPDADSGGVKAAQWAALWIGGGGKGICSR
jgi:hypothetical protein